VRWHGEGAVGRAEDNTGHKEEEEDGQKSLRMEVDSWGAHAWRKTIGSYTRPNERRMMTLDVSHLQVFLLLDTHLQVSHMQTNWFPCVWRKDTLGFDNEMNEKQNASN
jgi:hypothetical protein